MKALHDQLKQLRLVHTDGRGLPRLVDAETEAAANQRRSLAVGTATITWVLFQVTTKLPKIGNHMVRKAEVQDLEARIKKADLTETLAGGDLVQKLELFTSPAYKAGTSAGA